MGGNQSQTEESNNSLQMLQLMEQVIFGLNLNNINESIESYLSYFDEKYSYSFTLITCNLLYSYFLSQDNVEAFFVFLKELKTKEKINLQFIQILLNISKKQESNYLIEKMIENEIIDPTICENISNKNKSDQFSNNFISDELSQNDYELHKKLIKEGHNPNEITKIIRNDEIGKLQEISSHSYFDFDQKIEPSLYEKHSFVNKENVSLIDYAAFFGSVKCFKYLLMNGADIYNTGKFAIAGGNEEIIHLCEQNHSSFYKTYETAIKFHNNDIFKYLYENKLEEINGLTELGIICILYNNYEIFSFLIQEGLNTNVSIMNTAIETGNLFITMYLLEKKPISIDLCKIKSFFGNKELFDYLFDNMFLKVSKTDLANACKNGYIDVVKILLERKEFDINIKDEIYLKKYYVSK